MSTDHAPFCNCAECIGRFGLGPRPPMPAREPSEELAIGAASTSSSHSGFRIEMNDPGAPSELDDSRHAGEDIAERDLDELDEKQLDELERATDPER